MTGGVLVRFAVSLLVGAVIGLVIQLPLFLFLRGGRGVTVTLPVRRNYRVACGSAGTRASRRKRPAPSTAGDHQFQMVHGVARPAGTSPRSDFLESPLSRGGAPTG